MEIRKNRAVVSIVIALCLLPAIRVAAMAKVRGLGFVLDEEGKFRKVELHTRIKLGGGKARPYHHAPTAISITEGDSSREFSRIKIVTILGVPYPLGKDRLVINADGSVTVWDWRKRTTRTYPGIGSHTSESSTGMSPNEKWAVSIPAYSHGGAIVHDLARGTSVHMYKGEDIFSPRFSPDGARWAAFSRKELIIHSINDSTKQVAPIPNADGRSFPTNLVWSPSGRHIAGVIHHDGQTSIVVWESSGKLTATMSAPLLLTKAWPAIWSQDEKGLYLVIGNEGTGQKHRLRTEFLPIK